MKKPLPKKSKKKSIDEKVKKTSNLGGARPGAGRKAGGHNEATKERLEALRQFRERVTRSIDKLYNAQYGLALGLTHVFRVDEFPNTRGGIKKVHTLVTDPEEIKAFLDGDNQGAFYYITTKDPDNKAVDSLLDRTFGKAQQNVDVTTLGEKMESAIPNLGNYKLMKLDELEKLASDIADPNGQPIGNEEPKSEG